jgi:pyrimidine 5'-nucleotidase
VNLRLSPSWSLKCSVIFQIFTNADEVHAEIVLKKLGLEDCFEGIICFETINRHPEFAKDQHSDSDVAASQPLIICKPSQEAMRRAILLAEVDPAKTLYFDDSVRNIAGGKAAGLHTVLVNIDQSLHLHFPHTLVFRLHS